VLSLYHRIITPAARLGRDYHWWIAAALLVVMFGMGITSMAGDSAIVDEIAHIPAAYSYDHFGDYRLNPEHPPLIKNLAGLPLQIMHLKFPSDEPSWTTQVNGQWDAGWSFLYHLGNNAGQILFWARLPILLLAIFFGWLLYTYARRHWGTGAGLLILFFYTLSPNIIAHSRYVTTDLGASVFIFIAIITFLRFIRIPSGTNLFLLSLALATANLAKFNSVLLYPFLAVMAAIWAGISWGPNMASRLKVYVGGFISASALSLVWIYLYYIPNTIHMSLAVQDQLIAGSLTYGPGLRFAAILESLSHIVVLRPLVQYMLGVIMVIGRVGGGNITYFNGEITNQSFHWYFPELFLFKTQIALLILMVLALGTGLGTWLGGKPSAHRLKARLVASLRRDFAEWTIGLFAVFYFGVSVAGNLNLGIRHILPVYIPIFIVVGISTVKLARRLSHGPWRVVSALSLTLLVGWYGVSTVLAYPSFTSYFNELIGGSQHADSYFDDSGVDWGQDLLRLKTYMAEHQITTFALDYFGGADPRYYFCDRAYDSTGRLIATADGYNCDHSVMTEWHATNGIYTGQYIAVSETYLENDRYYSALNGIDGYKYLRAMQPVAKIGGSIYVYRMY
jgi:hypothetical protein